MPLTQEQVWAAADDLEVQGVPASLAALRKKLGKGSYTTISGAMSERKNRQAELQDSAEALPHAVEEGLAALGRRVWSQALACANDRLAADRHQFDKARAHIEVEREQAAELATLATSELDAAHLQIEALNGDNLALRSTVEELRANLVGGNERLAASNAQLAECERRLSDLNRELERSHEANAALIRALGDRSKELPATEAAPTRPQSARLKTVLAQQ